MFYSHTYLARKGPLATVWIAAHLQHRLKKSHYTSTDISATVNRIMEPEVPIALRMSGHLLLGVVRIYSKKVDYLFQDCNAVLTHLSKAFASIQITLPEDARQAPFQSITLPETFDLDALDINAGVDYGVEDTHLRSLEEITLTDQIPVMDYYVAITFDEDIMMDSSHTEVLPDSGAKSMEEDIVPQSPSTNLQRVSPAQHTDGYQSFNIQDPGVTQDLGAGPSNQTDVLNLSTMANNPQVIPETEIFRDANNDSNPENPPEVPIGDEPNGPIDQTTNDKDHTPSLFDDLDDGGQPSTSLRPSRSPTSAPFQGVSETRVSPGHNSPNLVLQPTPPIQQLQRRGRKRQQFFDTSTVLTNKFMKAALNDPAGIMRKRRFMPSCALYTWKMSNRQKKEKVFDQPLVTGLCKDLLETSQREYISAKPHLVFSEEDQADDRVARTPSTSQTPKEPRAASPPGFEVHQSVAVSPLPTLPVDVEMEVPNIEVHQSVAASPFPTLPVDVEMEVPNIEGDCCSPVGQDVTGTNNVAETIQTPDVAASTGDIGSQMETPVTETFQESFGLSDTHHLINSAEEELNFLEVDNNTPTSSQGSQGINSLSARTRAVARYLKNHSPVSPIAENPDGDLSLNKILEGKTRRISARMFFETLVLKNYDLIDVEQEEPYGDVSLKLTAELSKSQF